MIPSSGFGANPTDPVTMESMIASPRARAVASTAAATIAGRAARTVTVHIARQRLTPSETEPSRQPMGTARSASTTIAIMIGVIITVRIRIPTPMLPPLKVTTPATESLAPWLMMWLPTNGTSTRIPIRP